MKKILLIGGTGAIGVYLAEECVKLGYQVYVTSRKKHVGNANLNYVIGDGLDQSFLKNLFIKETFDAVVDFMIYTTEQFKERLDLLLGYTDHYIFISTYRVYADSGLIPIKETSSRLLDVLKDEEYLSTDEYGLTKARQEDILKASKYRNWTIVRPSITYSTSRFQFGTLEAFQFLKRSQNGLPIIMSAQVLSKFTTMTWAGDVAKMIGKLLLNNKSYSDDFNVLTNEHHTWSEVANYYQNLIGMKVVEVSNELYSKVITNKWQLKYDRMFNRICDNSKVLKITGLQLSDFMSLEEGLSLEINQTNLFQELSPSFPSKYDGRVDRVLGNYETLFVRSTLKNKLRYLIGRYK